MSIFLFNVSIMNQFEVFFIVLVSLLIFFINFGNIVIDFLVFEFDNFPMTLSLLLIYFFFIFEKFLLILRHLDSVLYFLLLI